MLVVTAVYDSTVINVIDDGKDGDSDDTYRDLRLERGQSLVHFIKDGSVNDDAGGKWDGDYFLINSSRPVIVMQATASEWQHDWVPADNKKMKGRRFYLFVPPVSLAKRDIDVIAYENDTQLTLQRISVVPQLTSGISVIDLTTPQTVLTDTLAAGQDLLIFNKKGIQLLEPGETYLLTASRDVAVQLGALTVNMEDGGGYVPSENGTVAGSLFYFFLPGEQDKKELRMVSFGNNNTIRLFGYQSGWRQVGQWTLQNYQHADWVSTGVSYDYYRITSSAPMSVFESNWLETTTSPGTADIATFVATENGNGAGQKFVIYIPPPGIETSVAGVRGRFSHLYLYAHRDNTNIQVTDTQTSGSVFQQRYSLNAGEYADVRIDLNNYERIRTSGQTSGASYHPYLTVESDKNIAVLNTNFNDNWMTYAASVLVPTPNVRINSSKMQIAETDTFTIAVTGSNLEKSDLENGLLVIDLPPGVTVDSVEAPAFLGPYRQVDRRLIWDQFTLTSGTTFQTDLRLTLPAGASPLPNGGLFEFQTLLGGSSLGDQYSSQDGLGIRYDNTILPLDPPVLTAAARAPGDTCIAIAWSYLIEQPILGFIVQSTSSSGKVTYDTLSAENRSWQTCPPVAADYTFEVLAFNNKRASPYSNRLSVPRLPVEEKGALIFYPFPNPLEAGSTGPLMFHYRLPEAATVSIELADVAGDRRAGLPLQSVAAGSGELPLPVAGLPADVYFYLARIELLTAQKVIYKTGKIAIIR